jgi:hypothetical protein
LGVRKLKDIPAYRSDTRPGGLLSIRHDLEGRLLKKLILAAAVAALATMAVASSASAGVERYQTSKGTLTVNLPSLGNLVHTFQVEMNPCDNSFTGAGSSVQSIPWPINEKIEGSLKDGKLSFEATYGPEAGQFPGWEQFAGYKWFTTAPGTAETLTATDSLGTAPFQAKWTLTSMTTSNYKNHGEYVSSQGGGSDAAHSCIGMPIH